MHLPPIPTPPQVQLPQQLVIPLEGLAAGWAVASIILGFVYLLLGVHVFRVMTTIVACLWGALIGVFLGSFIDSSLVGVLFCAATLGVATWFYTRWMVALPIGLGAAALAWMIARLNGANPLAGFFIALAAAVGAGGPVLMFYRTVVMALTCLHGAVLVVAGTSTGVMLVRHLPLNSVAIDPHPGGHMLLSMMCVLILAVPAFYFQRTRYKPPTDGGKGTDDAAAYDEAPTMRRKAA